MSNREGLAAPVAAPISNEVAFTEEVIRRLVDEYPTRRTMTEGERDAQRWVEAELARLGLPTESEGFTFNDNLYAVLALHFGLSTLGTIIAKRRPRAGATLQAFAGISYWLDATKRAEILRRVFPYKQSQNVLARIPARGTPRLRIVYLAHIDAAFTGILFHPQFMKIFAHKGTKAGYFGRSLGLATQSALAGAAVAMTRSVLGKRGRKLRLLETALAIPTFLSFALNAEIVARNTTVPGAADNLTGVAGALLLANRLRESSHPDVEHVFVITGAEEAGTGGARRLVTAHRGEWSTTDTVIIGLDTLSNGNLCYVEEGEQGIVPLPVWLEELLQSTAAADPRFSGVEKYQVPVGSTDVMPFRQAGYDGVTMVCVEADNGSPRHYHYVTDTPENTDPAAVVRSVDYVEAVVRNIIASRISEAASVAPTA